MSRSSAGKLELASQTPRSEFDTPWKEILASHFQQFMTFFYPAIAGTIDWSRPPEFLDKELARITRRAGIGNRLADKLVKVWELDGQEAWYLIHVEVQGSPEDGFAERMFVYRCRIFDLYHQAVVSLAVLTDDGEGWRPDSYLFEKHGCRLQFTFPTVKLLDYRGREQELLAGANPFAFVVVAHLRALQTRSKPGDRLRWRLELTEILYEKEWPDDQIRDLLRFIDWVMALPYELDRLYWEKAQSIEEERKMRHMMSIERIAHQKGWDEGWDKGIDKGRDEGLQEGLRREETLVRKLLIRRFGVLPPWADERLRTADCEALEAWGERLITAASIEEVFAQ